MTGGAETGPSWNFPRGTSGLRLLLEVADERALRAETMLAGTGLDVSDVRDADGVIDPVHELTVIRRVVHATDDDPGWGASVGSRLRLGMLGVWGYAMLLSPSLRAAFDTAMTLGPGRLAWTFARGRLEVADDGHHIVLDPEELPPDLVTFVIERDLAATASAVHAITGARARIRIDTALDRPHRQRLAAAVPYATVRSERRHAVVVDNRVVDLPLPYSDPEDAEVQGRACLRVAEHREQWMRATTAARVRASLIRRPDWPSMGEVAREHHIDVRTLRRRLDAEDTTFSSIVERARQELALSLLGSTTWSVSMIAKRLGYSDTAVFARAFKRWTGVSPGQHRQLERRSSHSAASTVNSPSIAPRSAVKPAGPM